MNIEITGPREHAPLSRTRETVASAAARAVLASLRVAHNFSEARDRRRADRLLLRGVTDEPSDWTPEWGRTEVRRRAFHDLYANLEHKSHELRTLSQGVQYVDDSRSNAEQEGKLFPVLHPPRMDGTYSRLFLFDPADFSGTLYQLQKHENEEYGTAYTMTVLTKSETEEGVRQERSFTIHPDDFKPSNQSPQIDVALKRRSGDRLESVLMTGSLFEPTDKGGLYYSSLLAADRITSEGYEWLTPAAANELSETVQRLQPVLH